MNVTATSSDRAWTILSRVADPEIPVLSVVDLGIVRDVTESSDGRSVEVTVTPTYSGCPATEVIARDIRAALASAYDDVEVRTQLAPAWTTDWMTDAGRDKLREFGIAPPPPAAARTNVIISGPRIGRRAPDLPEVDHVRARGAVECPRCGSSDVEELAGFGSTPCKSLWRCRSCREPFDVFKAH